MGLVNIEGVGLINFDDSMSPQQIQAAIENDILPRFGIQPPNRRETVAPTEGGERPAIPQRAPQPTSESLQRDALERNILDPIERGYQNLMIGATAVRARSPESFYGLSPESAAEALVRRQRRLAEIPRTEASQTAFKEAEETGTIPGAVARLATSSSALGDITAESFGSNPLAAPVGVLANVTPVPVLRQMIGALAGVLGFPTEFVTSLGDSLLKAARDQGVDTNNPQQLSSLIRAVNENPELRDKMRNDALIRAGIISTVDAVAGYGAGRVVTRGAAGRIGGGAAIEGAGGGAGEIGAQLATEGKIDPVEVAAEILGGGALGAAGNIRRSPGVEATRPAGGSPVAPPGEAPPPEPPEAPAPPVTEPPPPVVPPEGTEAVPPVSPVPPVEGESPPAVAGEAVPPVVPGIEPVLPEAPAAPAVPPPQFVSFNVPVGTQFPVITPPGQGGQTMSVDVVPEVVDLFSLVPASGRLQNRNIDAKANEILISKISKSPDFSQLTTSQYADRGAPVVGADNIVEVGNHRIAGLKKAAQENPEGFKAYIESLQNAGYDIGGMQFPVLIRRRVSDLDENQRVRFVKAANKSASQNLGPVELAREDAEFLTPDLLAKFDGTLEGGIEAAKNRGFVNDFISAVSSGMDLSDFISAKTGKLTPDGAERINRALFASAYQDQSLLEKAISGADNDLKSITGAMVNATSAMQALRRGIESGRIREEFNIIPDLIKASDRIRAGRDRGMTPAEILKIEDMVSPITPQEAALIRLLSDEKMGKVASKTAITRRLKAFAEQAATQTNDIDLVGGEYRITPEQAVTQAINPDQISLFSQAPISEESATGPSQSADPVEFYANAAKANVVYSNKDFALLETMNKFGNILHFGVMPNGSATLRGGSVVDVGSYDGKLVPANILEAMKKEKANRQAYLKDQAKNNPNGPFGPGAKVAFDKNFPENLRGFADGLVKELGLGNTRILFVDTKSAQEPDFVDRNKLFGEFDVGRRAPFSEGFYGVSINRPGSDFHTVVVDTSKRPSVQVETVAHEIGHVFDKAVLRNAPVEVRNEIMREFEAWLAKNKKLPSKEYVQALRTAVVGRQISAKLNNDTALKELDNYYREFNEWFADQVARWSVTSKPAQTLIGKFFQRIANAYRKIVNALGDVGLPNQTVAKFIEDHRSRELVKYDPVKTKGWQKKPKQMSFDMSAMVMPEQRITSAETSVKQVPATFKRVEFQPGTVNLDYGGGKFDLGTEFMREKGVENLVYDTFNRSQEHNNDVLSRVGDTGADTVTVNNVLNVVAEPEVRDFIIQDAGRYLKPGGTAYFLVYQGDGTGVGKETSKGFQNNAKAQSYVSAVQKHFTDVTRDGNLIIARGPKTQRGITVEASRAPPPTPPGGGTPLLTPTPPPPPQPTPQPALPLGSAADFYKAVIPDINNSSVLDRVLSVLIDKKKGESSFAAIARTGVNRAAPLYNLDEMIKGEGYTGRSAARAMELALMNSSRVAQMFVTGMGKYDPNTGGISFRSDVRPLLEIMKDAGAQNEDTRKELQVYLAALKERDLRRNGRQGFLQIPDGAVLDAITQAEAKHPEWKQTAREINKLNNALIDWAVDTGIIGRDQADKLRDVFYTPFYRVLEKNSIDEPTRSVSPRIGESFTNVSSAINRELKGGESPLGDLINNIILNADSIMKAGLKNQSMKVSAEAMEFARLAKKNLTGQKSQNTITFKVDGKDVSYDVEDPVLFSALAGMPRTMQNGIYNTMAKMASVFRNFVTAAPSFIMSSLYKGKVTAFVQEGQSFFTNTFAGVKDALNNSSSLQNFQLYTGFGALEYGMDPKNMAKAFERKLTDQGIMRALAKGKVLSAMRQSFSKMQELSEAVENAERIKLAENLIKKGMSPEDAYFQGYLLAPYARRGTGEGWVGSSLQFLMPLVPFLNAKIQTTYRLIENEKGDKRKLWTLGLPQQIFLRGLVVTGFSLLAYGLALADDEEKWDKIPPYMKLNYDIIPFMGNYITLPRAFEIGQVFGALPVFILDAIRRGEGKDLAEALVEVGKNTFFMNPMPKAVDPLISAVTNYDFFRMRPLETKGEQALPIAERVNRSTTKTGEALSATVNSIFGNVLSPIKAQALLDGYTGTMGVTIMNGFDSILAMLGAIPGKPAGAFGDPATMPAALANAAGFNRFYREDEAMVSRFVGDFYKIKEMTDQLVRSQNLARQNGDFARLQELRGEEGLPLRIREAVNSASTQIADLNKRIRIIEKRDIDGVAKAEAIRPLIAQRDRIAKRVVDRARDIGAL